VAGESIKWTISIDDYEKPSKPTLKNNQNSGVKS
jgi:hypothetical protein